MIIRWIVGIAITLSWSGAHAEFEQERLQGITDWMDQRVEDGKEGGVQILIAQHGEIVLRHSAGKLAGNRPIEQDSIFYVHSMTKAPVSVAALTLYERGEFNLFDPISRYLPEYRDMQVYVGGSGDTMVTRPAEKPITILQLLTHTSGIGYDFLLPEPLADVYRDQIKPPQDLEDASRQIAQLPLAFEPGSEWAYGYNTTIIGRLIEVVSGQSLDEFLQQRLFDPVGMVDTGYYITAEQAPRRSTSFIRDDAGLLQDEPWPMAESLKKPSYIPGDTGLLTTATDYFRFAQMLLNRGELDGNRVLSPRVVDLIMTDFAPPSMPKPVLPPGRGFTPAFSIYGEHHETQSLVSPGSVTWPGGGGSFFWMDPKESLVVVFMTQTYPPNIPHMQSLLETLVYQALKSPIN